MLICSTSCSEAETGTPWEAIKKITLTRKLQFCLGEKNDDNIWKMLDEYRELNGLNLFGPEDYPSLQYAYINNGNANLKAKPESDGRNMMLLPIGARVEPVATNDNGQWLLIVYDSFTFANTPDKKTIGWVARSDISDKNDFKPFLEAPDIVVAFGAVDSGYCYEFKEDGKVSVVTKTKPETDEDDGITKSEGALFVSRKLVWPKNENRQEDLIMLVIGENGVQPEYRYFNPDWMDRTVVSCRQ